MFVDAVSVICFDCHVLGRKPDLLPFDYCNTQIGVSFNVLRRMTRHGLGSIYSIGYSAAVPDREFFSFFASGVRTGWHIIFVEKGQGLWLEKPNFWGCASEISQISLINKNSLRWRLLGQRLLVKFIHSLNGCCLVWGLIVTTSKWKFTIAYMVWCQIEHLERKQLASVKLNHREAMKQREFAMFGL